MPHVTDILFPPFYTRLVMGATNTLSSISAFLAERRIALVGVSRNSQEFSRSLMREFLKRGYDVVPINPAATEIEGRRCYPNLRELHTPINAALIITAPTETDSVVHQCLAAGVSNIWLYRSGGQGSVTAAAIALCREQRINLIAGECPLMFLSGAGLPHRVHAFFRKIVGSYPINA
jgi:predicted CoA-binding protein